MEWWWIFAKMRRVMDDDQFYGDAGPYLAEWWA